MRYNTIEYRRVDVCGKNDVNDYTIKPSFHSRHQSISSAKRSVKRRKQNYAGRNALRSRDTDLTKIKLRLYGVGHRRAQNKFLGRTCSLQHTELDTLVIDWSDAIPDQP